MIVPSAKAWDITEFITGLCMQVKLIWDNIIYMYMILIYTQKNPDEIYTTDCLYHLFLMGDIMLGIK